MKVFSYSAVASPSRVQFLGESWEEGGVHTNGIGNPTRDVRGNTIVWYECRMIDPDRDVPLLLDAWSEDGIVSPSDLQNFVRWLRLEVGLTEPLVNRVLLKVTGRRVKSRTPPVPNRDGRIIRKSAPFS